METSSSTAQGINSIDEAQPLNDDEVSHCGNPTENDTFLRVQLKNLPRYTSYKDIKLFMKKNFNKFAVKKIRHVGDTSYFSCSSCAEAENLVELLDGYKMKGRLLMAKVVTSEPVRVQKPASGDKVSSIASDRVTPLANVSYDEQLRLKIENAQRICEKLKGEMGVAGIREARKLSISQLLEPMRASPVSTEYRNKCEFTVGRDLDDNVRVGFVGGRFVASQHHVLPVDSCTNVSSHMKKIVKVFEQFVIESGEPPFNEFERKGVWKMLTLRDFGCDMMMIATVFPIEEEHKIQMLKKSLKQKFITQNFTANAKMEFRVTSLYWQTLENSSDPAIYEHIAGAPYVYGMISGFRFRVSPGAFFQTNSSGAAVLYETITEKCVIEEKSLENVDCVVEEVLHRLVSLCEADELDAKPAKLIKLDDSVEVNETKDTVILDICCGTGTIGISVMKKVRSSGRVFLLGIEMVSAAIEDARANAFENGLPKDSYAFVASKAEEVFHRLRNHLPSWVRFDKTTFIGILDPPRAGIHEKVILGCRALSSLKRLLFISCNPTLSMKNVVNLCRPMSRKYVGEPFCLTSITPVDMFPQTLHCEWVVQLDR